MAVNFLTSKPKFYGFGPITQKTQDGLSAKDFLRTIEATHPDGDDAARIKLAREGLLGEAAGFLESLVPLLPRADQKRATTQWSFFKTQLAKRYGVKEEFYQRTRTLEWTSLNQKQNVEAFTYIGNVWVEVDKFCAPLQDYKPTKDIEVLAAQKDVTDPIKAILAFTEKDKEEDVKRLYTTTCKAIQVMAKVVADDAVRRVKEWITMKRVEVGLHLPEMRNKAREVINNEEELIELHSFSAKLRNTEENLVKNKVPALCVVDTQDTADKVVGAVSQKPQQPAAKKKNRRNKGKCNKCGKNGHWAKECQSSRQKISAAGDAQDQSQTGPSHLESQGSNQQDQTVQDTQLSRQQLLSAIDFLTKKISVQGQGETSWGNAKGNQAIQAIRPEDLADSGKVSESEIAQSNSSIGKSGAENVTASPGPEPHLNWEG